MKLPERLDKLHQQTVANRWFYYFTWLNRIALAMGFIIAGIVKIAGERFASGLSVNHPMGHYLEALYHTGYYYSFIGYMQIATAVLLLIPRTATIGAILYFPIILNICILSYALRFEGSILTSPLMVLANLYLLCWDYDKLKVLLSFQPPVARKRIIRPGKFPWAFFSMIPIVLVLIVLLVNKGYTLLPRNNISDCKLQFSGTQRTQAGNHFCELIFNKGVPLDQSIEEYERTPDDSILSR